MTGKPSTSKRKATEIKHKDSVTVPRDEVPGGPPTHLEKIALAGDAY